ncbi:methyl-accepting chemotaxis protein [Paenibacillus sp. MBLB4367]|uniref:HAMP domain-containing methyl-accepting chemotaxis protein n=1 Tax=Paenibacillus sp. MBLB4367 TaxID=3384767 RepID=UPI003908061D
MKVTIRTKMIAGFMVVVVLLLLTNGIAVWKMSGMGAENREIDAVWMPGAGSLGELNGYVSDVQRLLLKYILETNPTEKARFLERINESLEAVKSSRAAFEKVLVSSEDKKLYEQFAKSYDAYVLKLPPILKVAEGNDFATSNALQTEAHEHFKTAAESIRSLMQSNKNNAHSVTMRSVALFESGRTFVIVLSLIATAVALALALVMSQLISGSLKQLVALFVNVAKGDLRETASIRSKDELGELGSAVNRMVLHLRELIGKIMLSSQNLAAASQQISASTEEIAGGATSQANEAQTINEQFKELSRAIATVTHHATAVAELSEASRQSAEQGGAIVQGSIQGMRLLTEQMSRLQEDSEKIGAIIEAINDISEQTNLLALNAAIEAARAGDQGRGFAVVADEVRKLAERSSNATKEIGSIIQTMQANTLESVRAADDAVALSEQTSSAFGQLVAGINRTAGQMAEIAAACEQQSAQSGSVMQSVELIAASSEEAAAASEETASTSQELARLAEELSDTVSSFQIKSENG